MQLEIGESPSEICSYLIDSAAFNNSLLLSYAIRLMWLKFSRCVCMGECEWVCACIVLRYSICGVICTIKTNTNADGMHHNNIFIYASHIVLVYENSLTLSLLFYRKMPQLIFNTINRIYAFDNFSFCFSFLLYHSLIWDGMHLFECACVCVLLETRIWTIFRFDLFKCLFEMIWMIVYCFVWCSSYPITRVLT